MATTATAGMRQLVQTTIALPGVRPHAVGRAHALLGSPHWCRAREVADELVRCYVARQVP